MAAFLGYQIASLSGDNIMGDDECPVDEPSFAILSPETAQAVMQEQRERKFLLMPIYEGDIEEPIYL